MNLLVQKANEVKTRAYCPYSKFQVGAALITPSGNIYQGCNFENAAYGNTICAERCAISCMIANGEYVFDAIAIVTNVTGGDISSPCGACRQSMREFTAGDRIEQTMVIMENKDKKRVIKDMEQILPMGFGPDSLGIDVSSYAKKGASGQFDNYIKECDRGDKPSQESSGCGSDHESTPRQKNKGMIIN